MALAQLAYDRQIIVRHNKNQEVAKPIWVLLSPSGPMLQLVQIVHLHRVAGSQKAEGKPTIKDCLIPPPSDFQSQSLRVVPGSTSEPEQGSKWNDSSAQPSTPAESPACRSTESKPARLLGRACLRSRVVLKFSIHYLG